MQESLLAQCPIAVAIGLRESMDELTRQIVISHHNTATHKLLQQKWCAGVRASHSRQRELERLRDDTQMVIDLAINRVLLDKGAHILVKERSQTVLRVEE